MKQIVKLGVVCLARKSFDFAAAEDMYCGVIKKLRLDTDIEWHIIESAAYEVEDAVKAGHAFAAAQVDGIVIINGTFHLGHLVLEIKKRANKPMLLWAFPEMPYDGGKIRLNSICGINLNASNLIKSGYSDFTYTVGMEIDNDWVDAIRMIRALHDSRIGIIGYRAHGFFNVGVSELALYEKFGILIDHYELAELWDIKEDDDVTAEYREKLLAKFDTSECNKDQVDKVVRMSAKLRKFMEHHGLSAVAIRCWHEFGEGYGISPCASMSLVQADGYIVACEGDIDCTITMICHQAIGAETPYMADLSQVDFKEDTALMWHCGVAPCNLADDACKCTLDTYMAFGRGASAGFVMRSGDVSIARLDSINGNYRLLLESGKALPMEKVLAGTYAKVRFDTPIEELLDKIVYSGAAHHVSMVYGDYIKAFEIFARFKKLEVI